MPRTFGASRQSAIFHGYLAGVQTTGDGKDGFCVPFTAARLVNFGFGADVGGSANTTSVRLNRVRDESDTGLLAATLDLAHDASRVHSEVERAFTSAADDLQQGDLVRVDLDAIATGVAGVGWWVELEITEE